MGQKPFSSIAAEVVLIPDFVTSISGDPYADSRVRVIYGVRGSEADHLARTYGYILVPITN